MSWFLDRTIGGNDFRPNCPYLTSGSKIQETVHKVPPPVYNKPSDLNTCGRHSVHFLKPTVLVKLYMNEMNLKWNERNCWKGNIIYFRVNEN